MQDDSIKRFDNETTLSGIEKLDFVDLLRLIDEHYDKIEASITQSLTSKLLAPNTAIDLIFDSVGDALLSVGQDGVIRNCNKASSRFFGVPKEDLIGAPVSEVLPDTEGQALAEFLKPCLPNEDESMAEHAAAEVLARHANGITFSAEINASVMVGGNDRVFVIGLHDISDRKAVEKVLRENEERYRALVDDVPEAIIVYDMETEQFVDANDNACLMFNYSRTRLLSIGPRAINPPLQADGTPSTAIRHDEAERAMLGDHAVYEWLFRGVDGSAMPCEVRLSRLPARNRKLIRMCVTNVSERKRDEAFAVSQNKILQMIAEGAPFESTLTAVCECVGNIGPGLRAAVMQLDVRKQVLQLAEAPDLPDAFQLHIDFVKVAQNGRGSGIAVFENRQVFVTNISGDAAWSGVHDIADECHICSNWSFPVHGAVGRIIGALDVYSPDSREPEKDELEKLERIAKIAGIAINRHLDEAQLRNSESRYRGLFENVVDGVYIATRAGEIVTVNPALVEMLGYDSVDDLKRAGPTVALYVNPVDRERVFARLETDGVVKNVEYRLRRKDGSQIVVLENSRAICDEDGTVVAHEGTITDITDRKLAETQVFEQKERAQVTLQSIGDGVITTDANGNIDYINPVAQELTGWDLRTARGKPIDQVMKIIHEHSRKVIDHPVARCLQEGRVITLAQNSMLVNREGTEIPVQDSAAPIRDRLGNTIGAVMVFHDTGKESRLFRQLSYQASHDTLTGLINRREFENRLISALASLQNTPDETHALLYLDLDQFKVANDTFGHTAGDELLRRVAEIIQSNIRSSDSLARLGGDEFGILLEHCCDESALMIAEGIREAIESFRFDWKDASTNVRCSIGMCVVTPQSPGAARLMSSADVACYTAKDMGRNQVYLYKDSDGSVRHEEMKWVSRITRAVDENRLELFYQPIVGIGGGAGARGHYELLLRMRDENGNMVGPDQFIPAAERYNLMSTIDRWVINEALSQLADKTGDQAEAHYTLAINLSGTSLSEDRFLEDVVNLVRQQALPQGAICFEITETAAISNLSRVVHFMQTLKELGCKFSLDDFGSGLSSFTYLKNLPVDYLKIDGQFIRDIAEDAVDESMVRAINQVGSGISMTTARMIPASGFARFLT